MQKYIIPIAIVLAGGFIASALFFSRSSDVTPTDSDGDPSTVELSPVTNADHIRGNPDADLVVVEYSDYQCPYCKDFHDTMQQVMDAYGKESKVAWVFRHYPIESLHELAVGAAVASECVAELKDQEAFWTYSDALFAGQPDTLEPTALKASALALGIEASAYDGCIADGDAAKAVNADLTDGNRIAEANPTEFGTPYSIIVSKTGTQFPIAGALRYDQIKPILDAMLEEVNK